MYNISKKKLLYIKASWLPHVLKLCLGVSKGMLPVMFAPEMFSCSKFYGLNWTVMVLMTYCQR